MSLPVLTEELWLLGLVSCREVVGLGVEVGGDSP